MRGNLRGQGVVARNLARARRGEVAGRQAPGGPVREAPLLHIVPRGGRKGPQARYATSRAASGRGVPLGGNRMNRMSLAALAAATALGSAAYAKAPPKTGSTTPS